MSATDKLFFYSKSKDVQAGQGAHEGVTDPSLYTELNGCPHWRRVLSNFHTFPFKYNGHTYNSIEHVFQSEKIRLVNPDKALWFTLESGHAIGTGDAVMAQKNRKLVVLDKATLGKWDEMKQGVMEEAAIAKFKQCPEAARVLLATQHAQLWHIVQRKPAVRFEHLERIRDILSHSSKKQHQTHHHDVVMMCGYPASGKSTLAKELAKDLGYVILSRDEMGGTLKDLVAPLKERLVAGKKVVLDNTHLTAADRKLFIDAAHALGKTIEVRWAKTSLEDCQIRYLTRTWKRHIKGHEEEADKVMQVLMEGGKNLKDPWVYPAAALFAARKRFQEPLTNEGMDLLTVVEIAEPSWPKSHKNKAVFIDVDGTLRKTSHLVHKYPTRPEEVQLVHDASHMRTRLAGYVEQGYHIIGVSNQSGIGSGKVTAEAVEACMQETLAQIGLQFPVVYCPHSAFPPSCYCRKPQSGWGVHFILALKLDPTQCLMVGDMKTDETFGQRLGIPFVEAGMFFKD